MNQNEFSMTAPSQVNNKRDDVKLLPQGPNVGILYSMVDLGTHYNEHFKKSSRLLRLTFEFPFLKQLFKTDDTEERPTVVSMETTFQMAPKSNLKKFCDGALGRVLQESEYAKGFDVGQFLGKIMIVNIIHRASKKDGTIYDNIDTVSGITPQVKAMYNVQWHLVQRTNDLQGFLIGDGKPFATERFSSLPKFLRNKIRESEEAKAWENMGGQFAEPVYTDDNGKPTIQQQPITQNLQPIQRSPINQATPTGTIPSGMPIEKKLIWLNPTYTHEQMLGGGWNDDALVANGYAKWEEVVPPAPIMPQAPAMPQMPQAPQMPVAPVMPQQPMMPQQPQQPMMPQQPVQTIQPPAQSLGLDANGNLVDFSQDVDGIAF